MRVVAVIGPSSSGKTTLIEALAGLEPDKPVRLAATGGAAVTRFGFLGDAWAMIDIPGGIENSGLIGPALATSDAAILCAPAEPDAAVLCAPYLRLLEESGVPSFVFINGVDAATGRISEIVSELHQFCAHGILLRQVPLREGDKIVGAVDLISERAWQYREGERSRLVELPPAMQDREQAARAELLETLADYDDHLLEEIIEDQHPPDDEVYGIITKAVQHHDLLPALIGSAREGNGVMRLMKTLRHEVPQVGALQDRLGLSDKVLAVGSLADMLPHIGKAVLVRAVKPGVGSGNRLAGGTIGGLDDLDARGQISELAPGEIGLAIKSDHLTPCAFMTADDTRPLPAWTTAHPPEIRRVLVPAHERDENKLPTALARLAEIDPGLTVSQSEGTGHMQVGLYGPQHERRLVSTLQSAFGIDVSCEEAPAALRETLRGSATIHHRHRKQSGGAGQFADVVIEAAPAGSANGFSFAETVKGGAVPRNYIPAVEAGLKEALAEGPNGHPVVDIVVTLTDGKSHSVDSSDFAFRTAGRNALREAFQTAGTNVLQPIMQVQVHVPSRFAGDIVQTVSGLKGQLQGIENHPKMIGWDVVNALLPMAAEEGLARALASATRGTAWFESSLDHYEPVR